MLNIQRRYRRTAVAAVAVLVVAGGVLATTPAGAAVRYCQGRQVTIEATGSGTTINGTEGPDVIDGVGRLNLTINGLGGDDVICTGPGFAVVVHGGEGNDSLESEIVGGSGTRTELYGDAGDDVVRLAGAPNSNGSYGVDTLADGGDGDDHLVAEVEFAELIPGAGDDTITGNRFSTLRFGGTHGVHIDVPAGVADGDGHDTFSQIAFFVGSPGPDTFIGSDHRDDFHPGTDGGSAADTDVVDGRGGGDALAVVRGTVTGGEGNDIITMQDAGTAHGGPGDDVFRVTRHKSGMGTVPRVFGDSGDDRFDLTFAGAGWNGACAGLERCLTVVDGGSGRDRISFGARDGVSVNFASGSGRYSGTVMRLLGFEDAVGTRFQDRLLGDSRANVLRGLGGADVIRGRGGPDRLIGGSGRDRVDGGPGADRCQGEARRSC